MPNTKTLSNVEKIALERSGRSFQYKPLERIGIIEVENFPMLGKLTALHFLEWVQDNPGGVISLPTGKTPEHFIKYVTTFLRNWHKADVQKDLENNGIDPARLPDMKSLHFVQIDEFYPIDPNQKNSFYYYVKKYYIDGFDLDADKAMLMNLWNVGVPAPLTLKEIFPEGIVDLSLRHRHAINSMERRQKEVIEAVDQFCTDYEGKIQELGGIGFFLGGIGPDGHIAFNIKGSDHYSTTRLTPTNYETQAAAATDLGGIEVSRNRLVVTIGLRTITQRKDAVAIIIAAGEAKAKIVAAAIENAKNNLYPASILQDLPNARFYLTHGAASRLVERRLVDFKNHQELPFELVESAIIDRALALDKRIVDLSKNDLKANPFTEEIQHRYGKNSEQLLLDVQSHLVQKIEAGLEELTDYTFMHTAPHHDDIMLGYLPYIFHLVRTPKNKHFFTYMTSGFNAVTNHYVLDLLNNLLENLKQSEFIELVEAGYFKGRTSNRDWDVYHYLDGVAGHSKTIKNEATSRRLLRILVYLYEEESVEHLKDRINELIDYFSTQYPGKKDMPHIQMIKGMIREWEADLVWAHFGFNSRSVEHLRLGFYKGDIFTENPEFSRDVRPVRELMERIEPTVVTLAFDPEGSGPDTHYKVMQAIAEAVKAYVKRKSRKEPEIWGYRNVWYRFHPAEANVFVPVSLNSMAILENAFVNSFGSQRTASFPSYELDGPFSRLAQKIQAEQFQMLKTCLGEDYFNENDHPRLRACHGFCFIKKMTVTDFIEQTMALRKKMESPVA
ncbi:PIG-L family deacetylase [candidate division KSB1 bacterium]|nr:PIG-L family deacetylase [candidate division KSB1 bacterium]